MRSKTLKALAVANTGQPFRATDEQRAWVRALRFNNVPHERIAAVLNLDLRSLRYHFHRELELAEDEINAQAAINIMTLASMVDTQPAVALRANELIIKPRVAAWREPKAADAVAGQKRIDQMTLAEVQEAIARERERLAQTAGEAGADPQGEAEPG